MGAISKEAAFEAPARGGVLSAISKEAVTAERPIPKYQVVKSISQRYPLWEGVLRLQAVMQDYSHEDKQNLTLQYIHDGAKCFARHDENMERGDEATADDIVKTICFEGLVLKGELVFVQAPPRQRFIRIRCIVS